MGIIHEDQYTFFLLQLVQFFFEREMFQTNYVENIKVHSLGSVTFFENRVAYEMWKIIVEATDASIIWCMRFTCCIF